MISKRYDIVIGLNDLYSNNEEISTKEVIKAIEKGLSKYLIPFSIYETNGGYEYKSNKFVCENSIVVSVITNTNEGLEEFVNIMKMFVHQETILIQATNLEVEYL